MKTYIEIDCKFTRCCFMALASGKAYAHFSMTMLETHSDMTGKGCCSFFDNYSEIFSTYVLEKTILN